MADPEPQTLTVGSEIEIEGGAYAEQALLIVSYIDAEGNHKYAWRNSGEGSVATMLGLIELIRFSMMVENLS
jgi:hypothetical protein